MEEARKKLFEKAMKKFTMAELTKHQSIGSGQRNLIELISRYPGFGQGFKVHRKTWPEDSYIEVKDVHLFVSEHNSHFAFVERQVRASHRAQILEWANRLKQI